MPKSPGFLNTNIVGPIDRSVKACRERLEWLEEQELLGRTDLGPAFADARKNLSESLALEGRAA